MRISVCKNYDPKQTKDYNNSRVAHGWALQEIAWEEEATKTLTTEHGISGNEYRDGHKCNDSWAGVHVIMLDFDSGDMTRDALLEEHQNWHFDSYVFSSQNHQRDKIKAGKVEPACDRLRVLIPLASPITSEFDRDAVEQFFIGKYNTGGKNVLDASFMEKARYFAHGTTEVSSFISGKGAMEWQKIPGLYKGKRKKRGRPTKAEMRGDTFRLDDQVKDANEVERAIREVPADTPIYCPVCGDAPHRTNEGHNAVLMTNEAGLPFIFCSSCKAREMGVSGKGVYNLHPDDAYRLNSEKNNAMVFIDTLTSKFLGGCVEPGNPDFVVRELKSQEHVRQFCKSHKLTIPDTHSRARYELVFSSDNSIDFEKGYVNKYMAPDVLTQEVPDGHTAKLPLTISLLLDHVMAGDEDIIDYYINDLANFVQTRQKMITAYLVQGVEGTGKGLFFTLVLQKIFGPRYCSQTDQDAFGGQFNSILTDNVLVLVNEVSGNFSSSGRKNLTTIEKMKIAISDEYIQIEGKNKDRINGRNSCSFMFATNRHHGVVLSKDDRRFNVAPRQEQKINQAAWWPGYQELKIKVHDELQEFVWYLKQVQVDQRKIGTVIENEPKRVLQSLSRSNAEDFFEAVVTGNLQWIRDNLVERDGYESGAKHFEMTQMVTAIGARESVSMRDLCTIYNYINHKNLTVGAFGKLAAGYLPKPKAIAKNKDRFWGIEINWQTKEDMFD